MTRFLGIFILFISIYHLIITVLGYGVFGGQYLEQITIIKELIRGIATIGFALTNIKLSKAYFSKRKKVWLILCVLLLYSLGISFLQDKSLYSIAIGLKYNFHFIVIFLSATWLGFLLSKKIKGESKLANKFPKIIFYSQYFLVVLIFIGFVLQILKLTDTDRFLKIGYGPVGDFIFGQNPPVYYRTGPGGNPRRQGLFSGPNNYGYFLVALLPIVLLRRKGKYKKIKNIFLLSPEKILNTGIIILFLLAIGFTLSRTALVGTVVALALINKSRIQKNKKIALGVFTLALLAIAGLSIWKGGSTVEHFNNKINGIHQIIQQPLGHGLGTAGPAIHHGGSILPENYYLQVMADIGTVGFLIRAFLIFSFLQIFKSIQQSFKKTKHSDIDTSIYLHRKYLSIGRTCLLIMGLLLHVFEDSMVNYLFFIPFGILTGYLSSLTKTNLSIQYKHKNKH